MNCLVTDYGATGTGTTDDTDEIQDAIAACSASGGGRVGFPAGVYQVSTLGVIPDGVSLYGDGLGASVISTNSTWATVATTGHAVTISNLKFAPSTTRSAAIDIDVQGNAVTIRDCYFANYYIAINVGTDGGELRIGTQIRNCIFNGIAAAGSGAIEWMQYGGGLVEGCIISGPASGTQPDFGIRVRNGDTLMLSNTNVTLHGFSLLVDTPASRNTYALSAVNCLFDSAGTFSGGSASSAYIVPSGGVWNTKFVNCWFGLSAAAHGCYVVPIYSGTVDGLQFTGCEWMDNAGAGLYVVGSAAKNWTVAGGLAGGNGGAGVRAGSSTSRFAINGLVAGDVAGRGPNDRGILLDAGSDYYSIAGSVVTGNTTAGLTDNANGAHKFVQVVP